MQALKNITAAFCLACISAEVLAKLTAKGWARRCIKAAAGLYILLSLIYALPGAKAELGAFSLPRTEAEDFGTAEQAVLRQAEKQLAQTLTAQCMESVGVKAALDIELKQNGTEVYAAEVTVSLAEEISPEKRGQIADLLRSALGVEPRFTGGEDGT